jgi:hypothetical protein
MVLATITSLSQATTLESYEETPPTVSVVRSVTHAGRVRVTVTKTKPRIHLARIQQPVATLVFEDGDTDYYDELIDLQVGYRRPELVNQTADVDDISDEIKIRLLLARKRALEAYYTKWG